MVFEPKPGQDEILASTDPVLVVLGGAGTGKTSTAAALVRKVLDEGKTASGVQGRALFLSFSRAAVSQIVDRTKDVLGDQAPFVEITTFHAFAWRIIRHWGPAVGLTDPVLSAPSEVKLFGTPGGLLFADLLPKALELVGVHAIGAHLRRRWSIVVCDEFQDTDDLQFELICKIRGDARVVFLGDLNQCIYRNLPGVVGVGPERVGAALALEGARQIVLPDVSHRDPTNVLPAAATSIRRREFGHDAVRAALESQMLEICHSSNQHDEGTTVALLVRRLREEGYESVGVFSHHVDATANLSDHLSAEGIAHEIVGLPDATTSALQAQFEMLRFSAEKESGDLVMRALGLFVTSLERGQKAPKLALQIVGLAEVPRTLETRLSALLEELEATTCVADSLRIVEQVPNSIGLVRGERSWSQGFRLFASLLGPRLCRSDGFPTDGFESIKAKLVDEQISLLTGSDVAPASEVQLMGLYQSKGREADATVIVLREGDFYGTEPEPMEDGSKLLYVVLTRARRKTVILTVGGTLPSLVKPLALLSSDA